MIVVVDASIAVKWVMTESDSRLAIGFFGKPFIPSAPRLIDIEVAAALSRKVRRSEATEGKARESLDNWRGIFAGGLTLHANEDLAAEAFDISIDRRHAMQDCLYLALAERLGAPLITTDLTFAQRARHRYAAVRLLGEPLP